VSRAKFIWSATAKAFAAARHLASLGKFRNAVVVPTPPVDVPLTANVIS
jgi:hypothetical protein